MVSSNYIYTVYVDVYIVICACVQYEVRKALSAGVHRNHSGFDWWPTRALAHGPVARTFRPGFITI